MTASLVVVGVDVAKDQLHVAVRPSGEAWREEAAEAAEQGETVPPVDISLGRLA